MCRSYNIWFKKKHSIIFIFHTTMCNEYDSRFKDHFKVNMYRMVEAKARLFDSLTFYMIELYFTGSNL